MVASTTDNIDAADLLYNQAIDLINSHNLSIAIEMLIQALELNQDNTKYLEVLGLCFYAQGHFNHAMCCWKESVNLHMPSPIAEQYLQSIESDKFTAYMQIYNTCIDYMEKEQYVKALCQITPIIDKIPNSKIYNFAGLLLYQLGLRKSAIQLWKRSLSIDLSDITSAYYIANSKEGFIPYIIEKFFLEVLILAGKCKLL